MMIVATTNKPGPLMLDCRPGAVHVSFAEAGECRTCHTMRHFFVQRGTEPSQCIYCDDSPGTQHSSRYSWPRHERKSRGGGA